MPVNPSTKPEHLTSPIQRKNDVNDPAFKNEQGYFPYDLTHPEYVTPLFGELTPTMHLDTVPADRIVHRANMKTILNRINGNFLNEVNQYSDSFFISLRTLFPNNYEKLIPNPTKGSDLPNSALPQVPLMAFFQKWFFGTDTFGSVDYMDWLRQNTFDVFEGSNYLSSTKFLIARFAVGTYLLSRGQLLDYLGVNFDVGKLEQRESSYMQRLIDNFFQQYWLFAQFSGKLQSLELDLLSDLIPDDLYQSFVREIKEFSTISEFRQAFADIVEDGYLPIIPLTDAQNEIISEQSFVEPLLESISDLYAYVYDILFNDYTAQTIAQVDASSNPFAQGGYINISKILAYQLCVAQYYTNDSVDNIFNSELYMQLLRATMFPAVYGKSQEPVFLYNGVQTEYDYITTGAFYSAFFDQDNLDGSQNRMYVWATLMLLKRRSLRYGDYFSTARPRMLAVGDLTIPVGEGVAVVDVTKNLLMQRYLNAVNYIGSGFMQYMASIFGVTPSDSGSIPRFISHSKVTLMNQLTNNTAEEQGKQTTNLVGLVDGNTAVDVFIDDFGVILDILSYDVMPVYKSGIDMNYHLADRFDYFNPMMQNIGDQPIRLSELVGKPQLYNKTFGYTMRDSEYKFKVGKAHGAFVNELKGMLISYPLSFYLRANIGGDWDESLNISPDFIRDKAIYLDPIVSHTTGASPGNYYHFAVAVLNDVQCARKIQSTPPILF